jgi:cytochrome c-type biogenesis protein CcmH
MLTFWILVALVLALGLAYIARTLLRPPATPADQAGGANVAVYRDQLREAERDLAADLITPERHEQLRAEVQRRVLEDTQAGPAIAQARPARGMAGLLAVAIPLASVLTYLALGRPDAISALPAAQAAATAASSSGAAGEHQLEAMITALAQRMESDPGNVKGWVMLARSYMAMGRADDAKAALDKLRALKPGDADTLADIADTLAVLQGNKLAGEPMQLLDRALKADPKHVKALALAGEAAFQGGDYAQAQTLWNRALAASPADAEMNESLRGAIVDAQRMQGGGGAAQAAPQAPPLSAAQAAQATPAIAAGISGEVRLGPDMAARVAPGDTVFVYARAAQGSRMPLAIVRQPVGTWPLRFTLDDSQAMSPQSRLSGANSVIVTARVSRSGGAAAQSGDLIGESAPVPVLTKDLRIVIDRVQP